MRTLNSETVDALNMLLEDVRASVEIEVALSNGATEFLEREALTAMGVEDTLIAVLLRDWLESLNLPVTRRINGIVLQALDLTRYDDRLQLFVHHQLAARDQAEQLVAEGDIPSAGEAILRSLIDAHIRHAAWCDQRAREFAETRQLEFRRPIGRPRDVNPGDRRSGANEGDPLPDAPDMSPDTSGARNTPRAVAPVMAEPGMDDAVDAPDGSAIE